MDKYDALFSFGVILALCSAILTALLQLQGGNNPGMVLILVGIVVMIIGRTLKLIRKL